MRIYEFYDSVQGEGISAGVVTSFIRLAGCNLKCKWCDTEYAQADGGWAFSISNINPPQRMVCITGGEPLVQADELPALLLKLKVQSRKIEIETNGSIAPPLWAFISLLIDNKLTPIVDSWVVDIKLPSSGNPSSEDVIKQWAGQMRKSDQIKFVVANREDLSEAEIWMDIVYSSQAVKLISPIMPSHSEWLVEVAEFCIKHNLRLSLQLHKIIWGDKKGV